MRPDFEKLLIRIMSKIHARDILEPAYYAHLTVPKEVFCNPSHTKTCRGAVENQDQNGTQS